MSNFDESKINRSRDGKFAPKNAGHPVASLPQCARSEEEPLEFDDHPETYEQSQWEAATWHLNQVRARHLVEEFGQVNSFTVRGGVVTDIDVSANNLAHIEAIEQYVGSHPIEGSFNREDLLREPDFDEQALLEEIGRYSDHV
ncbi:hypothetical protein [Actinomyces vulturis]|uniref:hypothetical protein n=1 Tax=Actinomyces vulturis TaxID=1857645 RepID=UPI000833A7F6|nr:hypothetical protein [Actinomyces vulturis]